MVAVTQLGNDARYYHSCVVCGAGSNGQANNLSHMLCCCVKTEGKSIMPKPKQLHRIASFRLTHEHRIFAAGPTSIQLRSGESRPSAANGIFA